MTLNDDRRLAPAAERAVMCELLGALSTYGSWVSISREALEDGNGWSL